MKGKFWTLLSLTFEHAGVTFWSLKWHRNNRSLGGLVNEYLTLAVLVLDFG